MLRVGRARHASIHVLTNRDPVAPPNGLAFSCKRCTSPMPRERSGPGKVSQRRLADALACQLQRLVRLRARLPLGVVLCQKICRDGGDSGIKCVSTYIREVTGEQTKLLLGLDPVLRQDVKKVEMPSIAHGTERRQPGHREVVVELRNLLVVEVLAHLDHIAGSLAQAAKGLSFSNGTEVFCRFRVEDAFGNAENEVPELLPLAEA